MIIRLHLSMLENTMGCSAANVNQKVGGARKRKTYITEEQFDSFHILDKIISLHALAEPTQLFTTNTKATAVCAHTPWS